MNRRYCQRCGHSFIAGENSKAKYCSQRCRSGSSSNKNAIYHSGIYLTKSGRREVYQSGMEHIWMQVADEKGLSWCRADHIRIVYFNPKLKRMATYQPDFLVKSRTGYRLIELKPPSMLKDQVNQAKWEAARKWCKEHAYQFEVITSPYQH